MFKKLFLLLTLFSVAPAVCMEKGSIPMDIDRDDTVIIQTQEGTDFQVPVDLITFSGTLKDLIKDAGTDNAIPLPNITAATWHLIQDQLERVFAIKRDVENANELKQEIINAYKGLNGKQLIGLIVAVNYLDIPELLEITIALAKAGIEKITPSQIAKLPKNIRNPIVLNVILKVCGPMSCEQIAQCEQNKAALSSHCEVCVTHDNTKIISGSQGGAIRVWDIESGKEIMKWIAHKETIFSLCVTPDNKKVVSGSQDHTVGVWNIETGEQIALCKGHTDRVYAVACESNNKIIAASKDGFVSRLNLKTGKSSATYGHIKTTRWVSLAGGSVSAQGRVISIHQNNGEQVGECTGHTKEITSFCVTADNKKIISGSPDNTIRVWNMLFLNKLSTLNKKQAAALWGGLKKMLRLNLISKNDLPKKECWARIKNILKSIEKEKDYV